MLLERNFRHILLCPSFFDQYFYIFVTCLLRSCFMFDPDLGFKLAIDWMNLGTFCFKLKQY